VDEKYVARQYFNPIFRGLGHNTDTNTDAVICPRCRCKIIPEAGKPDMTVPLIYVEYKLHRTSKASFPFSKITIEQRGWLTDWCYRDRGTYLGLGVIDDSKSKARLIELYLIDWQDWLAAERLVSPVQASFPYDKITRKALRPDKNIITLFERFRLLREGRRFALPPNHSILTL
jgi:hypothetical protein